EETGYTTKKLDYITSFYTSPGFADEIMHIYYTNSITRLENPAELDDDEFVEVHYLTFDEAEQLIFEQKIYDAKTVYALMYLKEASRKKGIDMIGIIDCHAPHVQQEIEQLLQDNVAKEINNGGTSFEQVTLIMGAEIEVYDENCQGPIHVLCYFPTLQNMKQF